MATYNIRNRADLFRSGQVDTTDIKDGAVTLDKVAQDVIDYVDTSVANVSVDLTGYATETYVDNAVSNVQVDLTGYATETYVGTAIANLVDSAPSTLDTLNELAAALGDDANFATTVTNSIAAKQDTLVSGTNIKTINGESLLGSTDITIASASAIQLVFNETYVAAEGDTTFSITYDSIIGVFVNGIKLRPAEYDATSGTSIILNEALTEGATVDAIGYLVNTDDYTAPILPPTLLWGGDRGVFAGGWTGTQNTAVMEYVAIPTLSNATSFGNLTVGRNWGAGCSNITRGVFAGGGASIWSPIIDYITIATTGNATNFGTLTVGRGQLAGCSNGTRGVFGGGYSPLSNVIDYITIATTGNATNFGTLPYATDNLASCADSTIGLFAGGSYFSGGWVTNSVIDYVTVATTSNATSFGNLTVGREQLVGCSNSTIGLFGGGNVTIISNIIDYVTIATPGNATDFGDLTVARKAISAACANNTRAIFGAGYTTTYSNVIDYITIATPGNATDFGDLTISRQAAMACSGN